MSDNFCNMSSNTECLRTSVRIEDLFCKYRFQENQNIYKIVLYFPIGILLLITRVVVGAVALLVLALLPRTWALKSIIFKSACKFVGLVIHVDDKHLDENCKLLVANHISILDRLAVNSLVSCKTVDRDFQVNHLSTHSFWKDIDIIQHIDSFTEENVITFQKSIEGYTMPILSFPEGAMTNGTVGLLKFRQFPFALKLAVQPVVIQVSVSSFINISPCVLGSNMLSDILWLLFLPCIVFTLKVLPCMVKLPEETVQDFSKRTQTVMAAALGLTPTIFTSQDKAEFIKRSSSTDSVRNIPMSSNSNSSHHSSVFPKSLNSCSVSSSNPEFVPKFNTAAKTFGKSPKERMQSYKERKDILIKSARMKYLQSKEKL